MRILVTTQPEPSHLWPMVRFLRTLEAAGHELLVGSGVQVLPDVERAGLSGVACGLDWGIGLPTEEQRRAMASRPRALRLDRVRGGRRSGGARRALPADLGGYALLADVVAGDRRPAVAGAAGRPWAARRPRLRGALPPRLPEPLASRVLLSDREPLDGEVFLTPEAVCTAVEQTLAELHHRQRSAAIGTRVHALPGTDRFVEVVEKLAS